MDLFDSSRFEKKQQDDADEFFVPLRSTTHLSAFGLFERSGEPKGTPYKYKTGHSIVNLLCLQSVSGLKHKNAGFFAYEYRSTILAFCF